jgi:uncharacterized membrane protein YdjX (TVP38/TMEM64 family)
MQAEFRLGGPLSIARLVSISFAAAFIGIPSSVIAVIAGLLVGPIMGASTTSFALTLASGLSWSIGRYLYKGPLINSSVDGLMTENSTYKSMMSDRSTSGFHWTAFNSFCSVMPFPLFAFIAGQRIQHLSFQSMITGVFAGSLTLVAGYALAGASIGCSLINYAQGIAFTKYNTLMVISCLILAIIARLQSQIESQRNA